MHFAFQARRKYPVLALQWHGTGMAQRAQSIIEQQELSQQSLVLSNECRRQPDQPQHAATAQGVHTAAGLVVAGAVGPQACE
jgi:hypothetical protein